MSSSSNSNYEQSSDDSYEPYVEPTFEEIIRDDQARQIAMTTEYKIFDMENGKTFFRDSCSVIINFQPSVQYDDAVVEITSFYCDKQRGRGNGAKLMRDVLVYLKNTYPKLSHCILTPVPSIPEEKLQEIREKEIQKYQAKMKLVVPLTLTLNSMEEKFPELSENIHSEIEIVRSGLTNNLIKYYQSIGFDDNVPDLPDYLLGSIYNIVNKIDSMGRGFKKTKTKTKTNAKRNKKSRKQKQTKKKNKHIFQ